jgi:hypothetical protein
MLGFKRFQHASITVAGIELVRRIRKGQFKFSKPRIQQGAGSLECGSRCMSWLRLRALLSANFESLHHNEDDDLQVGMSAFEKISNGQHPGSSSPKGAVAKHGSLELFAPEPHV